MDMEDEDTLPPDRSVDFIVKTKRDVTIDESKIPRLGDELIKDFKNDPTPLIDDDDPASFPPFDYPHALDWLFVANVLDFSHYIQKLEKDWNTHSRTGYLGICAAINEAIKNGQHIVKSSFYTSISKSTVYSILHGKEQGDTTVPFLHERTYALRSSGETLIKFYDGSFKNCVLQSKHSAKKLVEILIKRFEYFIDEVEFNGKTVTFHRKALLLAIRIWAFYKKNGIDYFDDIHEFVTTTTNELPQTFLYYNIFTYSPVLETKIKKLGNLPYGHHNEAEIRGCTIYVLKKLKEYINEHLNDEKCLNPLFVNDLLTKKWKSISDKVLEANFKYHLEGFVFY